MGTNYNIFTEVCNKRGHVAADCQSAVPAVIKTEKPATRGQWAQGWSR